MKSFNVIRYDFNSKEFEPYDVIPYFVREYQGRIDTCNELKSELDKATSETEINLYRNALEHWKVPVTFEEFKHFVKVESLHQFWSRCEYEIVLGPWPYISSPSEGYDKSKENDLDAWKQHWKKHLESCDKWDIHDQIMMNLDIVTQLVMEETVPCVTE